MVAPREPEYYRERSHHFLYLTDDLLNLGETELACESLWGAAAHALKAIAQRKGWEHGSHALLLTTVNRLIEADNAPPHIRGQYFTASDLHVGFYGDRQFNTNQIRLAKEPIAGFVQTLESLP